MPVLWNTDAIQRAAPRFAPWRLEMPLIQHGVCIWHSMMDIEKSLFDLLIDYSGENVFNQYRQVHPVHDLPDGHRIRRENLRLFFKTFTEVKFILLAEAAGYRGCRFSGIPMTAEFNLVGPSPVPWARDGIFRRSSRSERLWREPSATILWETLGSRMDCLIWNTFPWHPMGKKGPLSNRTPNRSEVASGIKVLHLLLSLYPDARPVAVGRIAERTLKELGWQPLYVRHPAHGGKNQFVEGIHSLI